MREQPRCPRKNCGEVMTEHVDQLGRVSFVCRGCARNKSLRCRDCPAVLVSRHFMRCEQCRRARHLMLDRERDRRRYPLRRKAVLADHKRRARDPVIREHRNRYMRDYRAKHGRDGFDRAYNRVYMAVRRSDPVKRARENRRKRQLRAMQRKQQRMAA